MHRQKLLEELHEYSLSPHITEQERKNLPHFITFVKNNPGCFERSHAGHITGSAWVVSPDGIKSLLTHHRKLNLWLQVGGHADGESDIAGVAFKEAQEETGLKNISFVTRTIFDIDIHPIPSACQFHYDVRYLLKSADEQYVVSEESFDLKWIPNSDIKDGLFEASVIRMNEKFRRFFSSFVCSTSLGISQKKPCQRNT